MPFFWFLNIGYVVLIATTFLAGNANADFKVTGEATVSTSYSLIYAVLPFRETPFSPLVGIHPVSDQEAETRKHFRFNYDGAGRLIEVAFMQGEDVVDLNDSANYYYHAPRVEITYGPDTEIRVFYDKHGNRIKVSGEVFREVYRLNDHGYRSSLEFYDVDGELTENSWGVAHYEWTLHDDGVVAERRYNFKGELAPLRHGFPFFEIRLRYGANGWLALMQNYGREGQLTLNKLNAAQDRLEYAANGDLHSWNVLDENGARASGNGPGIARGIMEYHEYGYEIVERYENEDGEAIKNAYEFSYTRAKNDEFGNRIERSNYALDGGKLLISEGRGYAGYTAVFDEQGRNRILISFFDEDRQPIMRLGRGYYAIRSKFDQDGNEIETQYQDENGNPIDRDDIGVAIVKRVFDQRGRLVETSYHNASGDPVNHWTAGHARERLTYGDHGVVLSGKRFFADGGAAP